MNLKQAWTRLVFTAVGCLAALGIAAATGCGGDVVEADSEELESASLPVGIGDVAFGHQSQTTSGFGNPRCSSGPSVQCALPYDKTVTVKVTGTNMSASQKADVEGKVDGWIVRFDEDIDDNGWTVQRITSGTADVDISFGSNPATSKSVINTYAHAANRSGTVTTLDDFGTSGTWVKAQYTCTIDNSQIVADFLTPEEPRVLAHAVDYCVWKGLGVGGGGPSARSYSTTITAGALKSDSISAKVKCWLDTYDPAGSTILPVCVNPPGGGPCVCPGATDN
jgi:hypothetical protein